MNYVNISEIHPSHVNVVNELLLRSRMLLR